MFWQYCTVISDGPGEQSFQCEPLNRCDERHCAFKWGGGSGRKFWTTTGAISADTRALCAAPLHVQLTQPSLTHWDMQLHVGYRRMRSGILCSRIIDCVSDLRPPSSNTGCFESNRANTLHELGSALFISICYVWDLEHLYWLSTWPRLAEGESEVGSYAFHNNALGWNSAISCNRRVRAEPSRAVSTKQEEARITTLAEGEGIPSLLR